MSEKTYNLEELHRGKWQPLKKSDGKQKFVKITDEEAEIMNSQSTYSSIRYVPLEDALDKLRKEYEEVVGKAPHHKMGEEKLLEGIAKANENK